MKAMVRKVPTPAKQCHHACSCVNGAIIPGKLFRVSLHSEKKIKKN